MLISVNNTKRSELRSIDKKTLAILSIGGFFAIGLGTLLFLFAMDLIGAARTTIIASSSPLFSTVLGVTILKEKLDKPHVTGIMFIIVGIYILMVT